MRILLVASGYNSMTQRMHAELADRGYEVSVELALGDEVLRDGVRRFDPDIVLGELAQRQLPAAGDDLYLPALRGGREHVRVTEWSLGLAERLDATLAHIRTLGSATVTATSAIRLPSTVRIPPSTVYASRIG